jgi:hypothetical protein
MHLRPDLKPITQRGNAARIAFAATAMATVNPHEDQMDLAAARAAAMGLATGAMAAVETVEETVGIRAVAEVTAATDREMETAMAATGGIDNVGLAGAIGCASEKKAFLRMSEIEFCCAHAGFPRNTMERQLEFPLTPTRSRAAANSASFSRRACDFLRAFSNQERYNGIDDQQGS